MFKAGDELKITRKGDLDDEEVVYHNNAFSLC